MANLQVRGIDDTFYETLKRLAAAENRSVSQQVLTILQDYVAKRQAVGGIKRPAEALLELAGSWVDDRSSEEIIDDIRKARKSSRKLSKGF